MDVTARVVTGDADVLGVEVVPAGDLDWVSTIHICSGVKFGGEQGVLLTKPSLLKVKHVLPGPMPLLTASLTSGNPPVEDPLKKNSWSAVVSPSPAARPPGRMAYGLFLIPQMGYDLRFSYHRQKVQDEYDHFYCFCDQRKLVVGLKRSMYDPRLGYCCVDPVER